MTNCPPSLLSDWLPNVALNRNSLFRIAYGETESWLMADRIGFSGWMQTKPDLIPVSQTIDKFGNIREIVFPYKPSLFMMREIVIKSKNKVIKEGMIPKEGAKKGPLYNSTLIPFIQNIWDFHSASDHSTSLQRTIYKIVNLKLLNNRMPVVFNFFIEWFLDFFNLKKLFTGFGHVFPVFQASHCFRVDGVCGK